MPMLMPPPFSFMRRKSGIIVPTLGALVVTNGQTVDIAEGGYYAYSSIQIDAGGTLRITGNAGEWTEIGVAGDCIINGTILSKAGYAGQATHAGQTKTRVSTLLGTTLSHTTIQANGGSGGSALQHGGSRVSGGAQSLGRGGGGAGGGQSAFSGILGGAGGAGGNDGSRGSHTSNSGNAGVGGGLTSGSDGNGPHGGAGAGGGGGAYYGDGSFYGGGGGGGGYKGAHGKPLLLYVEGTLGGSGTVNAMGDFGKYGGSAGAAVNAHAGGRGGGGAGGSGGRVVVRHRSGSPVTVYYGQGLGGDVGVSGDSTGATTGSSGTNGSLDYATI